MNSGYSVFFAAFGYSLWIVMFKGQIILYRKDPETPWEPWENYNERWRSWEQSTDCSELYASHKENADEPQKFWMSDGHLSTEEVFALYLRGVL